jgi:hypothetical protein
MKREYCCLEVPQVQKSYFSGDVKLVPSRKLASKPQVLPPGISSVKNSSTIEDTTKNIILECLSRRKDIQDDLEMMPGTGFEPTFMFFLGVEGKDHVSEMQCLNYDNVLYVSSNIETLADKVRCTAHTSNRECHQIASYFGILDPLGGGSYPLNYMVVVDTEWRVRCKMPIRMNPRVYGSHEKFGASFEELGAVVDQYMAYFS